MGDDREGVEAERPEGIDIDDDDALAVASCTPPTILVTLEKRDFCQRWGVDH